MTLHSTPVDFSDAKILVIGDVMLDQYWYGESSRISPEAPIPIVHSQHKEIKIGGAANVAANISALGAQVFLLGAIGKDEHAKSLLSLLDEKGIQHYIAQHHNITTITKTRIVANGQQVVRIDEEEAIAPQHLDRLYQHYQSIVAKYDVIVLSDYLKGTLYDPQRLIKSAQKTHKIVLVDPKGTDYTIYKNAFCITPNSKEFNTVCGQTMDSEQTINQHMVALADRLNLQALLLTKGAEGMSIWQRSHDHIDAPIINIPTQAKLVYDVSGAGDTVIATLACGLAQLKHSKNANQHHHIVQESVHYANQAAGIAVTHMGSYAVSIAELNRLYTTQHAKYIGSQNELEHIIEQLKKQKKTIVFTNGCFDILHSGHVHCIEEAAKFADQLIIAINSDASVKRLKGHTRPINTLMDRVDVLSAIGTVDWVVDFGDDPKDKDTPLNLIRSIHPDVLVKGSDYSEKSIIGADFVKSYGGEVRTVAIKKGYSSSQTIDLISQL